MVIHGWLGTRKLTYFDQTKPCPKLKWILLVSICKKNHSKVLTNVYRRLNSGFHFFQIYKVCQWVQHELPTTLSIFAMDMKVQIHTVWRGLPPSVFPWRNFAKMQNHTFLKIFEIFSHQAWEKKCKIQQIHIVHSHCCSQKIEGWSKIYTIFLF